MEPNYQQSYIVLLKWFWTTNYIHRVKPQEIGPVFVGRHVRMYIDIYIYPLNVKRSTS